MPNITIKGCIVCRNQNICKWVDEEIRLNVAMAGIEKNEDSPLSIQLYCDEFNSRDGFRISEF
jgi:hypothetical protein